MLRLGALTRLRRLGLAGTSVKDAGLALVAPLAALETLSLEWCSRITDAGAQDSGSTPSLQSHVTALINCTSTRCLGRVSTVLTRDKMRSVCTVLSHTNGV